MGTTTHSRPLLVSVITPTMNSARWMSQCVGSVLTQNTDDVEVEHIIAEQHGCTFAHCDPADNLFEAANKAARSASGHLVGFLGSDDVLLPGALDAIVQRYLTSGRRWVTGSYAWVDADMRSLGTVAAPPERVTARMLASLHWCYLNNMATYLEATLFEELGGYDAGLAVAADHDLLVRARALAPFAREPQVIAAFRRHGSNQSMVGAGRHDDAAEVLDRHGPAAPWQRFAYRRGLQVWINGRNPSWSLRKRRPLLPEAEPGWRRPDDRCSDGRGPHYHERVRWVLCAVVWVVAVVGSLVVASETTLGPIVLFLSRNHGIHVGDIVAVAVAAAGASAFTAVTWITRPRHTTATGAAAEPRPSIAAVEVPHA